MNAIQRVLSATLGLVLLVSAPSVSHATDVLTARYDNGRTGTTQTPGLNASVVRSEHWRKLGELGQIDGRVFAQPLFVEGLQMADGSRRDVVYVATTQNKVYAFDARSLQKIWGPTRLGNNDPSRIGPPLIGKDLACDGISQDGIGIQATPVIDRTAGKMYVTYRINTSLRENDPFGGREMLRAIDIRNGNVVGAAVEVSAPAFNPVWQRSRTSLLHFQGLIYVAYGSRCEDIDTFQGQSTRYHGWVFAFDASNLARRAVYQTTPSTVDGGGIWQASSGLAADADSIYFATGNRRPGADKLARALNTPDNLADSVIRLVPRGLEEPRLPLSLTAPDWFTPYRRVWMDEHDMDLGSAGAVVIPNSPFLLAGGKQGLLYVINRADMGKVDLAKTWDETRFRRIQADSTADQFPEDFSADKVQQKLRVGFNQFVPEVPSYLAAPGSSVAVAKQLDDQLDVFTVGRDKAAYVTWERADGPWSDGGTVNGYNPRPYPARITPAGLVPLDAYLATAKQTPDQLDLFWVGTDGAIWVTWVVGVGQWSDGVPPASGPVRITPPGFAKPGACIATGKQRDDQLDVFVVRDDGAVWVTWVTGTGHWSDGTPGNPGPARITPVNFAVPGRCTAAAHQSADQLDVFFVRPDGAIYVTWVSGKGHWSDGTTGFPFPARITPTGLAPGGADIAAAKQTRDQLDAFVVGHDGAVHVTWVTGLGKWSDGLEGRPGPARITPANLSPPGSSIATSEQLQDQLDVFVIDKKGTMQVTWVTGTGKWSDGAEGRPGPARTTNAGLFPEGARLAAAKQNANRLDAFGVSHDGAVHMTWVDGAGRWADGDPPAQAPVRLSRALWMRDWVAWPHIHGTPVFARFADGSASVYVWPEKDHLKSIPWTGSKLDDTRKRLATDLRGALSLAPDGMPGGMLTVSVDPTQRRAGVLFAALSRDAETEGPGVLRAYDAVTLREIWNNEGEKYGFSKFVTPTIAGGRVFVPTASGKVLVYGSDSPLATNVRHVSPRELLVTLKRANVHSSQGDATLLDWMSGDDAYYRKLAEASMTLIGERRLSANGVDLLKVNYFYLRELGLRDEAQLPPDHAINPRALERAFVLAHRDMNGSNARAWADIVRPR